MVRLTLALSVAITALLASLSGPALAADDFQSWKAAIRDAPGAGDDAGRATIRASARYRTNARTRPM